MRGAPVLAAALLLASTAGAERSAGSTSLVIGKMHIGTRAIALAGACSAVAGDPSAIWWNPAGLARMERTRLEALHIEQGQDIRVENVLGAVPLPRGLVMGASGSYLSQPPIPEIVLDATGNPVPSGRNLTAFEYKAAFGAGQALGELLEAEALGPVWTRGSIGAAVTVLGEKIGPEHAVSASLDLGYLYEDANEGRAAALVVRNLGAPAHGRPLPVTMQAGVAQRITEWNFSLDVLTAVDDSLRLRGGVEWTLDSGSGGITIRGGMQHSFASELIAPYGAGLAYHLVLPGGLDFSVEYAWSPVRGFDDLHAASLQVGL